MAGPETIHRIVEKIEVQGKKEAKNAFAELGGAAGFAARLLGLAKTEEKSLGSESIKLASGLTEAQQALQDLAHKTPPVAKKVSAGFNIGKVAAWAFKGAIGAATTAVIGLGYRAIRTNFAFADLNDQLTGLYLATGKFAKSEDPIARFERSSRVAKASLEEFEKTAFKTATKIEQIAALGSKIEPVMFAAGKSAWDVTRATDAAASAAKVLQINNEVAAASFIKMIMTGKKTRDPFGMVVGAEAAIKKTDSLETRIDKLTRAAAKVGAPVGSLAAGTGDALTRAQILIDKIVRRLSSPIFEKVGEIVGNIVDKFGDGESTVDELVYRTTELYETVNGVGRAFRLPYDVATELSSTIAEIKVGTTDIGGVVKWVGGTLYKWLVTPFDLVGTGARAVLQAVKDWNSGQGFGRTKTLLDSLTLKMRQMFEPFYEFIDKLANMAIPDWLAGKVPILRDLRSWADSTGFKTRNRILEESIAARQENFGMDPTTELGKRKKLGATKEDTMKLLKGLFGEKRPLINIEELNIKQDFRDQDPDRVITEFVHDLERLGENAIQSSMGGQLTALGPGG